FYITIFARYPSSIYSGSPTGEVIRFAFSYVLPILLVVTVPARVLMGLILEPSWLAALTVLAGVLSLMASRGVFLWSLRHYRSASS
ncbi:MAG: ABC-2 family transporter protein, partial [Planctomycetaceae bacterium]|nr:ABC-2 family transporter protein [Planctomycetaceae bacterium]